VHAIALGVIDCVNVNTLPILENILNSFYAEEYENITDMFRLVPTRLALVASDCTLIDSVIGYPYRII
jgi:hypothetical protein